MDTMTHPDYQRKGLFVKLATKTYADIYEKEGHYYLLGFPGIKSRKGFEKKLNWTTVHIGHYIFTNRYLFNLHNLRRKNSSITFKHFTSCENDLKTYLSTKKENSSTHKIVTNEVMTWKIFKNPNSTYKVLGIYTDTQLSGVCIYIEDAMNTCQITWLDIADNTKTSHLLTETCRFLFNSSKKKYLYTWAPTNKNLLSLYKKNGFVSNPFASGPFSDKFPFIKLQKGINTSAQDWLSNQNFDFEPIMLD